MNVKIIVGAAIVLAAVYYGSSWLKLRSNLTEQLQEVPYIKNTAGHFLDFSMKKSQDAPMCGNDCEGVSRYLFTMKGNKSTLLLAADYNKISHQFGHRVYCDQSGKAIRADDASAILTCR